MRFCCVLCAFVIASVACPRLLSSRSRFARVCLLRLRLRFRVFDFAPASSPSAFPLLGFGFRPCVFVLAFFAFSFLRLRSRVCAFAFASALALLAFLSSPSALRLAAPSLSFACLLSSASPSFSSSRLVALPRPCCLSLLLLPRLRGAGVRAPPVPGCASPKVHWVCGCGCALPKTLTKTKRTLSLLLLLLLITDQVRPPAFLCVN